MQACVCDDGWNAKADCSEPEPCDDALLCGGNGVTNDNDRTDGCDECTCNTGWSNDNWLDTVPELSTSTTTTTIPILTTTIHPNKKTTSTASSTTTEFVWTTTDGPWYVGEPEASCFCTAEKWYCDGLGGVSVAGTAGISNPREACESRTVQDSPFLGFTGTDGGKLAQDACDKMEDASSKKYCGWGFSVTPEETCFCARDAIRCAAAVYAGAQVDREGSLEEACDSNQVEGECKSITGCVWGHPIADDDGEWGLDHAGDPDNDDHYSAPEVWEKGAADLMAVDTNADEESWHRDMHTTLLYFQQAGFFKGPQCTLETVTTTSTAAVQAGATSMGVADTSRITSGETVTVGTGSNAETVEVETVTDTQRQRTAREGGEAELRRPHEHEA